MGWRSFALSWFACVLFATVAAQGQAAGDNSRAVPAGTLTSCPMPGAQLRNEMQSSRMFGESRHYRIFLPANYDAVSTRYPVIYYFHGSSDRYTLESYDNGRDTVPKICNFVASHAVIVVAIDGYIATHYTGFYGGAPYDIRRGGGDVDFGSYFLEFVSYIDSNYRTLASRRNRAVSGLSMGGFMSLYLSARYPDVIGSCSAFNPGPEFYVGGKGRLSLWRPKDYVLSYQHTPVRLVRASGDYISQYTEETHAAFAASPSVKFEFRQDEYHRHWATSIGETFEFHMRAFADASLDDVPQQWNYASAYNSFDVWGYHVQADIPGPGVIYLEQVSGGGMLLRTRRWAPDGPAAACMRMDVTTAPLYERGAKYTLIDWSLDRSSSNRRELTADGDGRLHFGSNCGGHALRIAGPGVGVQPLVLLPATAKDFLRVMPGVPVSIPVRIWNPGETARKNLRVKLTSQYPTVDVLRGAVQSAELGAGKTVDLTPRLSAQFTAGDGDFARARLMLVVSGDDVPKMQTSMDVLIAPSNLRPAEAVAVLDGRTRTFPIFWQGVHGGGASVARTVTEGKGNGDGSLEPGERATVWVKLPQGLDPFDKENWCRAKVFSDSRWLTEIADIQEDKRREWTGAQNRTSLMELNPATPKGTDVNAILDCEAYSFAATPDVRYGSENLYQPFQLHKHYLFLWSWKVGAGINPSAK